MYKTDLHASIIKATEDVFWSRSSIYEDNFRQLFVEKLKLQIDGSLITIPPTTAKLGDVNIGDKIIEIKYFHHGKDNHIDHFISDFDLLLERKVDFCILAIPVGRGKFSDYPLHEIGFPSLSKTNVKAGSFGINKNHGYQILSVILPICDIHPNKIIDTSKRGTNVARSYLTYRPCHAIERSSFIKTKLGKISVRTVGSREDGMIILVYARADRVILNSTSVTTIPLDVVEHGNTVFICDVFRANIQSDFGSMAAVSQSKNIEDNVIIFESK